MKLPPIFGFIRRFGFWRGIEFRRVAKKCDRDPHLLISWATHYQSRASGEFRHNNAQDARAFLAFAEMLRTTHDRLVLNRKVRRPILTRQQRRLERALKKFELRKLRG